jgi:hypothetical protein
MLNFARVLTAMVLVAGFGTAFGSEPKIAVTDLTYQEKVSEYFRVVSASSKSSVSARGSERETPSTYSARGSLNAQSESSYTEAEGVYTYIERGELRTYTADLKGALLKGGGVRLVQAKPYTGKPTEQIYDIIGRIKQGYYPGADYVLFGTVSNIEFRQETMQLKMANSATATLSLDLVVDFSLINTKTYEIKAAFSASGSGQDAKILSRPGDRVVLNRGKVISETSKSLAEAAYAELMTQFGIPRRDGVSSQPVTGGDKPPESKVEPVKVY